MAAQQPKRYRDHIKLRHKAFGTERRRNLSKIVLEHGTPLPKPIEYSDFDTSMVNWVKNTFRIVIDGKELPTYKLFSNQRISEYGQLWQNLDEKGNLVINFKAVTRENNPQVGEEQGNYHNIPGHKRFAMFYVPVLGDNGVEAYDKYTMEQPFPVNFMYKVSIVTNSYELLNEMNQQMQYEFSAINCYLNVNGHPMPMRLQTISDDSEYTIDDWKYYSQSFDIKVLGYIIKRDGFHVERIPSRITVGAINPIENADSRKPKKGERVEFAKIETAAISGADECGIPYHNEPKDPNANLEPVEEPLCPQPEEKRYVNKKVKIFVKLDECTSSVTFTMDKDVVIDGIEVENIYDFRIIVNGKVFCPEEETELKIMNGDEVTINITREDLYKGVMLTFTGYDPNIVLDTEYDPESSLDEVIDEEDIYIGFEEEENQTP